MDTKKTRSVGTFDRGSLPPSLLFTSAGLLITALFFLALAGCDRSDEVVVYTKPKESLLSQKISGSMPMMPPHGMGQPALNEPRRMLAAMIRHGEDTWFFKVVGPVEALAKQADAFTQFVQSVRFSDAAGGPTWTLPRGWQRVEQTGPSMRFATIRVPTEEGPAELSVISLRTPPGSYDDYVLANVNRWRGQFGLPPIGADQLDSVTTKVDAGDAEAIVVNLVSRSTSQTAAAGLPPGHPPIGEAATSAPRRRTPVSGSPKPSISYQTPEGWTPAAGTAFSVLAFEVRDGSKKVQITLTPAGGDLLTNVNRWRRQLDLPPISANQLEDLAERLQVSGAEGTYVKLLGATEAILGVIVTVDDQTWFVKLSGDKGLAEREEEAFRQFVRSLKL